MNILMVVRVFPPRYAGAAVQAIYLSKELTRRGLKVDFLTDNFADKNTVEILDGMKVHKISTCKDAPALHKIKEAIYFLKSAKFILGRPQYDIIFFHSIVGFDTFLFPLCKLFRRRSILELTLVNNDDPLALKKRRLGCLFLPAVKCTDKIIAISTRLFNLSLQADVDESQLEQIPVGVDTSKFFYPTSQERQELKRKLGYEKYSKIFLAVGQIEPRKGFDFLMQAWLYISERIPNAVLLIAGPRNDDSNHFYLKLKQTIAQFKLDNVKFLGMVQNIQDFLKITDCFLHCAVMEGLPNVLLEAGCSGVPIVCRKIEHITSDIILNQNMGRECDSNSPKEFADQVFNLLKERNEKQVNADIDLFRRKFDIKVVADRYLDVFNKLHSQKAV